MSTEEEIQFPDLEHKKIGRSSFHKDMKEATIKFISSYIKANKDALIGSASYLHSQCKNTERMITLSKYYTWFLIFEDQINSNTSEKDSWMDVFSNGGNASTPLQQMYADLLAEIKPNLTEPQLKRFTDFHINCVTVNNAEEIEWDTSGANFFRKRFRTEIANQGLLFVEYALQINLSEDILDNYLIKKYCKNVLKYCIIIKDLYAFRDRNYNSEDLCNYVKFIEKHHESIAPQIGLDFVVSDLYIVEQTVDMYKEQIIDTEVPISAEFLDTVYDLMIGYASWQTATYKL